MRTQGHNAPLLRIRNASVAIAGRSFFQDLNWQVNRGEHWAIVGPNGAGKTLLAGVLTGAVPLLRGEVEYLTVGQDTDAWPPFGIEHVAFESHQHLLAGDETYYQARWESSWEDSTDRLEHWLAMPEQSLPGEVAPIPKVSSRFQNQIFRLLGLRPLLQQRLRQLSNGETRKALLARALLRKPGLLILDDPFGGLDIHVRRELGQGISRLIAGRLPLLFLTARPEELPTAISHVLWLDQGRVVAQGLRNEVLATTGGSCAIPIQVPASPARRLSNQNTPARLHSRPQPVILQLCNVQVTYDGHRLLDNLNWTIRRGENWVLLGPNGSGKTTLLSLIMGDNLQVYANDITHFGHRLGEGLSLWDLRKKLALVSPDLQAYYPGGTTGYETVCSGFYDTLGLHRQPSARKRKIAAECLDRFGLQGLADEAYGALSAGQQRLLLLARALVKQPRLLILDEPCQGLDAANRQRVLETIEAIGAAGKTHFLFVTHHREEIPQCATHLLELWRGNVVRQGPIAEKA